MHHIFRGEFPASALKGVLDSGDKELFDAFFIFSFIMLSSIRDDLILEDLAGQLFKTKVLCDRIIAGETSLEEKLGRGEYINLLNEFFETVSGIVHDNNGLRFD